MGKLRTILSRLPWKDEKLKHRLLRFPMTAWPDLSLAQLLKNTVFLVGVSIKG